MYNKHCHIRIITNVFFFIFYIFINIDEDCKKRWRSIRDHYTRLKREGKLGTGSAARKTKIWPLLNSLSFLNHVPEERRSVYNSYNLKVLKKNYI